jgi:hypothetical protein
MLRRIIAPRKIILGKGRRRREEGEIKKKEDVTTKKKKKKGGEISFHSLFIRRGKHPGPQSEIGGLRPKLSAPKKKKFHP